MDDYHIFRAAQENDYAPLIGLLHSEEELLPRHRELLIEILEGKLTRPRHRQAGTLRVLARKKAIAKLVHDLESEGCKLTAAIVEAANKFGCSEGTVKNALRDKRENESVMALVEDVLARVRRLYDEGRPEFMEDLFNAAQDELTELYQKVGLKRWRHPRILADGENK